MWTKSPVTELASEAHLLVGEGWDLSSGTKPETTLLAFVAPFVDDFRDFVRLSWSLQTDAVLAHGHAENPRLVLFHPRATHQMYSSVFTSEDDNPSDYVLRSPFPTIHLLREEDVMRAASGGYHDLESLPSRNKARLILQGLHACTSRLERCYNGAD